MRLIGPLKGQNRPPWPATWCVCYEGSRRRTCQSIHTQKVQSRQACPRQGLAWVSVLSFRHWIVPYIRPRVGAPCNPMNGLKPYLRGYFSKTTWSRHNNLLYSTSHLDSTTIFVHILEFWGLRGGQQIETDFSKNWYLNPLIGLVRLCKAVTPLTGPFCKAAYGLLAITRHLGVGEVTG